MKNELRSCHNKTNWVNSVRMQDFWVLLRMDSISWRKTLEISHSLIQWPVVNTLFQEKKQHHNRKAGSKETSTLGPYGKLQPVICMVNMELRSELRLWAERTLTPGSDFLMDQTSWWWIWTTMKQKFPKISSKNMRWNWVQKILHADRRQKQKPQRREPAGSSPRIVPIERRNWIDIEPGKYSLSEDEVSKKVIYLLRRSQQMHREEDWAFHFWRMKEILQNQCPQIIYWSDDRRKSCLAAGGGVKRRFQYCTDDAATIVCFPSSSRTFRTQSYWSFITRQCCYFEQLLPAQLQYWMCVQSSFYHQLWINTWRSKFEQETDSILPACWSCGQKSQRS